MSERTFFSSIGVTIESLFLLHVYSADPGLLIPDTRSEADPGSWTEFTSFRDEGAVCVVCVVSEVGGTRGEGEEEDNNEEEEEEGVEDRFAKYEETIGLIACSFACNVCCPCVCISVCDSVCCPCAFCCCCRGADRFAVSQI